MSVKMGGGGTIAESITKEPQDMEQNTNSWHAWRAKGIGASESPIIMGVSPWSTPYQLWQEKTGRLKRDFSNYATERGHRLEPKARASYEFKFGYNCPPILATNQRFPFIRASLDGWNAENGVILEIKCPGRMDHEKALAGQIPEKYFPQIQHQFLAVGNAKVAHYYSYDGERGVCVECLPDLEYQEKLFEALCAFWQCIRDDVPPPMTEKERKKYETKHPK